MSLLSEKTLNELKEETFSSLSRLLQIEEFLKYLYKTGHTKITPQEISQLFKDANLTSPQHSKKIRCGAFKVKEYLETMLSKTNAKTGSVYVTKIATDKYKIYLKQ